jgi:hypothetical protein
VVEAMVAHDIELLGEVFLNRDGFFERMSVGKLERLFVLMVLLWLALWLAIILLLRRY